jgi:hypothetical protein
MPKWVTPPVYHRHVRVETAAPEPVPDPKPAPPPSPGPPPIQVAQMNAMAIEPGSVWQLATSAMAPSYLQASSISQASELLKREFMEELMYGAKLRSVRDAKVRRSGT